jgi:formate--tetrahydrofolate ligase
MADWQIAEAAEEKMPTPDEWGKKLGLKKDEILAYGKVAKVDFLKVMERLKNKPDGKYIEVTAVTPTPLGEGKTTTTMGPSKSDLCMIKRGMQSLSIAVRRMNGSNVCSLFRMI